MEIEEVLRMEDRDGQMWTMWRMVGGQLGEQFTVASLNPNQPQLAENVGWISLYY